MRDARLRLSLMMALQFLALGTWYPVLPAQLQGLGYSGTQVGVLYSLMPLACILTPLAAGQLADRRWPMEKLLGYLHLIAAGALLGAAYVREYTAMVSCLLAWSLAFAPTFTLGNAITFAH